MSRFTQADAIFYSTEAKIEEKWTTSTKVKTDGSLHIKNSRSNNEFNSGKDSKQMKKSDQLQIWNGEQMVHKAK